jgi:hypothetical protein
MLRNYAQELFVFVETWNLYQSTMAPVCRVGTVLHYNLLNSYLNEHSHDSKYPLAVDMHLLRDCQISGSNSKIFPHILIQFS